MRSRERRLVIAFLFVSFSLNAQIDSSQKVSDTVRIVQKQDGFRINGTGGIKSEILNKDEFKKAACCTLSESFESTNTVEVSSTDGVSGVKKIEMLGLASKYVLISRNQMTLIRGVNTSTGMSEIPGPMVENVYVAKGAGSVTNGYESITGGIDIALKLEKAPHLFVNGYYNNQSRNEQNIVWREDLGKKLINVAYAHRMGMKSAVDNNNDGFADMPLNEMLRIGDVLKFQGDKVEGMVGFTYVDNTVQSGQIKKWNEEFDPSARNFKYDNSHQNLQVFGKLGIFLPKGNSIGNIFQFNSNDMNINTRNPFPGTSRNLTMYQDHFRYVGMLAYEVGGFETKSGIELNRDDMYDSYTATSSLSNTTNFKRVENVVGAFTEWTKEWEKTTLVLGARVDHSDLYGTFFTPRLHFRQQLSKKQSLHFQAGGGRRTPFIFAENYPYLISNRVLRFSDTIGGLNNRAYGQNQEIGYNTGLSYTANFLLFGYTSTLSADAFFTYFQNQLVVDRDSDPTELLISAQKGTYSQVGQIDLMVVPRRRMEYHFSYRFAQAMQKTNGKWQQQVFQSPHRFVNVLSYETRSKWSFNAIWQVNSPSRYPNADILPANLRRPEKTPWLNIVNCLVQKTWKAWEFYGGVENILNVRQQNPILSTNNTSNQFFDAAYAWGPSNGINGFIGFRYTLM